MKDIIRKSSRFATLEAEVAELKRAVTESRRLNERLSDVLDVITELLVVSVDRDDERLKAALDALAKGKQRATE
ncbi:MAG: DUF6752 domain-containing protein [Marmoricola sp.]